MEISIKDIDFSSSNIIDIRSREKYNDKHIPGALNIDYRDLINNHNKYLDHNKTYYIYCQRGIRSRQVMLVLRRLNYNVISIMGGYEAYILGGYDKS